MATAITSTSNSTSTSTPVSIASSSSAAAAGGSVINVSSLVSQLVAATRAPQDALISSQTQTVTTQISAVGTLKGALSTFQSALAAIDTPSSFNALSATSSNSSVFSASTSTGAVPGSYSVAVSQLAQAQQLVSTAFTGPAATLANGSLQLSLGGARFSVQVDSTDNTLTGLAAAINAAPGNPGITATVINGTDGAHLLLSSSLTGAANSIQVAETDGGTALAALTYGSGNTANYTQDAAAQDAQFSISGIPYTSASNTVSDALNGVTLTLLGTTGTGGSGSGGGSSGGSGTGSSSAPATLTISADGATIQNNVSAFVKAYNTLVGSISSLNSYDSTSGTAGPMLGDAMLSGIQNGIRSALYSVVNTGSSTYNSLASVGITTNSDGTLKLNSSTFAAALSASPGAVSALFSGTGGVAATLNTQITDELGAGGAIASRSQTLIKQENGLTQQTDQLNAQMSALTASLTRQYSQLNALLSSLQTTSAYLTQQFAALPQVQSSKG
ncbi:MAG: flagellar filament capping protein FliD [Sinobacteraceae bacterium]|nr:flagellar filament capping protein FliD [Nevskiaceae bacterium]